MAQAPYAHWFVEKFGSEGTSFGLAIQDKLHEEQSAFQHIEIYQTETFGRLMVLDGCIMLTDRDNFLYHEMITHPALFCHPNPQQVVVIGGGDCGTLKEVLKHQNVVCAHQVEIDERVTRMAEQFFPDLCTANQDSRARFSFCDGIAWIHEQPASSLDLVIIDSTDPVGPAEGLFRAEFYKACARALKPTGLLVQQSESPLLHSTTIIRAMHDALRASGFPSVNLLAFPQPVYPTGWWSVTMAGKETLTTQFRKQDSVNKPFKTRYYNADIHQAALAQPEFVREALNA